MYGTFWTLRSETLECIKGFGFAHAGGGIALEICGDCGHAATGQIAGIPIADSRTHYDDSYVEAEDLLTVDS